MGKAIIEAEVEKKTDSDSWRLSVDNVSSEGMCSTQGDLRDEDTGSSSDGSPSLGWPLGRSHSETLHTASRTGIAVWNEKREKRQTEMSEVEMMKERFAKLHLGEDMSGGGKGVSSALAISNAITNLSASVFGEIRKLEPLPFKRESMWRREMEWLLSVADYIVELVPSWQTFPNGKDLEVMVTRPRSDLHINLPALRKLDTMLLESLDTFSAPTEFWYVEQGIVVNDEVVHEFQRLPIQRRKEKWWLPSPKVPVDGLSSETVKHLKYQRECINQMLKAALSINNQTLSEMEVPDAYWDGLPKNGKVSMGETMYKRIVSRYFSAEAIVSSLDIKTDHVALDLVNRIEAASYVWRRKRQGKLMRNQLRHTKFDAKASWDVVRDYVLDIGKRELLAGRAESLLHCLKQRFPELPQSLLDRTKIQYNRDIGQSILESYSRVLESLAFNIIARIEDVLYVDEISRRTPHCVINHTNEPTPYINMLPLDSFGKF